MVSIVPCPFAVLQLLLAAAAAERELLAIGVPEGMCRRRSPPAPFFGRGDQGERVEC
jgi:hypothetical protein